MKTSEHEISIDSGDETLAGTFTVPVESEGEQPAVLILPGSGPLDRDGNHKRLPLGVSKDLSDLFLAHGYPTLRYDKRGVGRSSGDYLRTGFWDEVADAEAALSWMLARDDVSGVVVAGHSAGSLQAVELAADADGVVGVILLAHTAKSGRETLEWQAAEIGKTIPAWITRVMRVFGSSVEKQQRKALDKIALSTEDVVRIQFQKMNAKWMREFIVYEPMPALERMQTRALAITGSKDVQVDPGDIDRIASTLGSIGTAIVISDVDHILRHEPNPQSNPKNYKKQVLKPIDQRIVEAITDWIGA